MVGAVTMMAHQMDLGCLVDLVAVGVVLVRPVILALAGPVSQARVMPAGHTQVPLKVIVPLDPEEAVAQAQSAVMA